MVDIFEKRPFHDQYYFTVCVAGFLLAGMMYIVMGIYSFDSILNFETVDPVVFNLSKLIMMSIVIVIGCYGASKGVLLESMYMIVIGIASTISAASALLGSNGELYVFDLLTGLAFLFLAVGFYRRGDWFLGTSIVVLAVGTIGYILLNGDVRAILIGVTYLIMGLMVYTYCITIWSRANRYKESYDWITKVLEREYRTVVCTGYLIMTLLMLLVGLNYLNTVLEFTTIDPTAYNFAKIFLSAIIIIICMKYFKEGAFTLATIYMTFGLSTLTFSAAALANGMGGLEVLDIISGITALITCFIAYMDKEHSIALISFFVFLGLTFYPFFDGDIIYYIVGIPITLAALVVAYGGSKMIWKEVDLQNQE